MEPFQSGKSEERNRRVKKIDVQGYLSCVGKEKGLEICGNYDITGVEDIFWG